MTINLTGFGFCSIIATAAVMLSGCSTSLKVWDENRTAVDGVPVRISQTYEVKGMLTGHSKVGKNCDPTPFYRTMSLPTGRLYYVNIEPGSLAENAFDVQFTDQGSLKSVSLNSKPAPKEAVEGVVGLATDVIFPVLGIGGDDANSSPVVGPQNSSSVTRLPDKPSCDVGETGVSVSVLN